MLSSGFMDLMSFLILVGFTIKGGVTGFIRSVVTLTAAIIAVLLASAMPNLLHFALKYSVPEGSLNHDIVNHTAAFWFFFVIAQCAGFIATGLLEKIGLGSFDKAAGILLGIVTGVFLGCLPVAFIYASPDAYSNPQIQRLLSKSFFLRTYQPLVKAALRPSRRAPAARKPSPAKP